VPIHIEPTDVLRLKQRREFLRVAGAGHKWVAPGLILQARTHMPGEAFKVKENDEGKDGNDANGFRLGFTVSRKVGGAVDRNRARRRLRAAAERVMPRHARHGNDFVLIGRRATLKRRFQALVGDLQTALRKLDAYEE
jgi:ribonuclease P protein component